jgi:hypothetical protein
MIKSRTLQLALILTLACICAPVLGGKIDPTKMALSYEIKSEEQQWIVEVGGRIGKGPGKGPIKPTHVAELFLPYPRSDEYVPNSNPQRIIRMLKTAQGQSMSSNQRSFLSASKVTDAIAVIDRGKIVRRHYQIRLYAMSELDARKMAEAFIEAMGDKAETVRSYEEQISSLQVEILQNKRKILDKQAESEVTLTTLRESIKNVHYLSIDEAKRAILELNTMLNNLDIELAGMNAKLIVIQEQQKAMKDQVGGINREGILLKLENMWIDLLIEFQVAEAKKKTATEIRSHAEDFCKRMNAKQAEFQKEINELNMYTTFLENDIRQFEEKLADPDTETWPPKIYQNKVAIYPVK